MSDAKGERDGEPIYHVFRLGVSGRIEGVEIVQAGDDKEAEAMALTLLDGRAIEL